MRTVFRAAYRAGATAVSLRQTIDADTLDYLARDEYYDVELRYHVIKGKFLLLLVKNFLSNNGIRIEDIHITDKWSSNDLTKISPSEVIHKLESQIYWHCAYDQFLNRFLTPEDQRRFTGYS